MRREWDGRSSLSRIWKSTWGLFRVRWNFSKRRISASRRAWVAITTYLHPDYLASLVWSRRVQDTGWVWMWLMSGVRRSWFTGTALRALQGWTGSQVRTELNLERELVREVCAPQTCRVPTNKWTPAAPTTKHHRWSRKIWGTKEKCSWSPSQHP